MRVSFMVLSLLLCGCAHNSASNLDSRIYDEQAARYDRQLNQMEEESRRYRALLDRWERQADRFDAILNMWEKQAEKQSSVQGPPS